LDNKGEDGDGQEQPISANALENVEGSSQDTSVDLVEHLHENEDLENVSHMEKFLRSSLS
jgi:hypothetical protein